jgi:drug/metabolite transporter (DMT)-like permease
MTETGAGSDSVDPPVSLGGLALIVLLAVVWGLNWPAIRVAVLEISPWIFRGGSLIVGSLTLFAFCVAGGKRLIPEKKDIGPLILVGVLNVSAYQMLTGFGLTMVGAGRGSILAFTFPLWVVVFSVFVLHERLTRDRLFALILGLGAMGLLLGPEILTVGKSPLGGFLLVGGAIAWAAATLLMKSRTWSIAPRELAAWQVGIGMVPVLIGALIIEPLPDFSEISTRALLGFLYCSVIAVAIGQWTWFRILEMLPSSVASISTLAVPVIGVMAGAVLLGEEIGWRDGLALVLVVVSLFMVTIGRDGLRAIRRSFSRG